MTTLDTLPGLEGPQLAKFAPVLARFEQDCATRLGVLQPHFTFERFMSRPYSEIVQLRVTSPGAGPKRVFVKIARAGSSAADRESMGRKVAWAFDTMAQLYRDMAGLRGLSVAKPLACYPEQLTIVTEGARGLTLLELLESKARWWPPQSRVKELSHSVSRIGEWLRHYQRVTSSDPQPFSLAEMRDYIDVRLRILVELPRTSFTAADRQRVLDAFDATASLLRGVSIPSVHVHADFAPGNVLVDEGDIVVLDFAVPARGSAYHDVAHLYMQLGLLSAKPQFRPALTRGLQRALLEGFEPGLAPDRPLFQLLLFQHVACHFLGLARSSDGPAARVFNWHLIRRHRRWMDQFGRRSL